MRGGRRAAEEVEVAGVDIEAEGDGVDNGESPFPSSTMSSILSNIPSDSIKRFPMIVVTQSLSDRWYGDDDLTMDNEQCSDGSVQDGSRVRW